MDYEAKVFKLTYDAVKSPLCIVSTVAEDSKVVDVDVVMCACRRAENPKNLPWVVGLMSRTPQQNGGPSVSHDRAT